MVPKHTPVLLKEVIEFLNPKNGEFVVDGTFGSGGHSKVILEKLGPDGKLLAVDWDETNLTRFKIQDARFKSFAGNYANLEEILKEQNLGKAEGLLLDLGFSSEQLGNGRGFSFREDEPLLMTYNDNQKPVREIIKDLSEEWLEKIIKEFGEERYARKIASAIKASLKQKPIETTKQLAEVIANALPKNYERGRIHPATRTFQALRIYANQELENLEHLLNSLPEILKSEGRAVVISFHSLEDRIVKNHFRNYAKEKKMKVLTKKPIVASREEILSNPRARSAKLRAAIIL